MPTVIDWTAPVDPSEIVRQARDVLAGNGAVVLPGDSGYLALWRPGARVELPAPATLAWTPDDAAAQGAAIPPAAHRLMFRAWPAPLVVELPVLAGGGFARFRCPDHPLFESIIPAVADLTPVLVADTGASTVTAACETVGEAVGLAINGGERPVQRPTVVRATDAGYEITEPGAFAADEVEKLAARIILFVCTGNTCRSPLAEALAKKLLADRLGCTPEMLPARGFWVLSAGVAAYGGSPASEESAAVAAEFGADLSGHTSRPVNPPLLAAADQVFAMTQGHLHAIARYGLAGAAELLCGDADLDDPIGADQDVYRECARTIMRHLERLVPGWVGVGTS